MYIYILLYFLFYFTFGSGILYFSRYFVSIGISSSNAGVILATGAFLTMIFQPFLGYINDKTGKSKQILGFLMVMAFVSLALITRVGSFYPLLFLYTFYAIAMFSKMPLMDTIVVLTPHTFGKIRLWGSIGFAVGGLVSGRVIDIFGAKSFLYLGMLSALTTLLIILKVPNSNESNPTEEYSEKEKVDLNSLFYNKKYLVFLLSAMLLLGTNTAHTSFFATYFELIGGSMALFGITIFTMTISEVPILGLSTKLVKERGADFAVLMSLIIVTIRWFLYFLVPHPLMIIITFILQGASIGLFFGAATLFIKEIVKKNTLSTAIMIFVACGSLGGVFIQLASGIIMDELGAPHIYAFYGILTTISIALMLVCRQIQPKVEGDRDMQRVEE